MRAASAVITAGTAYSWNPTVAGAKSEDTFIVAPEAHAPGDGTRASAGAIPVSNAPGWPTTADGRPDILSV